MKEEILLLLALVSLFIFFNYPSIDGFLIENFGNQNTGFVERVIDGDTAIINNHSVRFLGINSPEVGEKWHDDAMDFMKEKIEGKNVTIIFGKTKTDLYGRWLAYIFIGNENVNLKSVENGFSNFYFPDGKDFYYNQFFDAWKNCLNKNINLCEKSNNTCIKLETWDPANQNVILKNVCTSPINMSLWSVKDEGRKKYVFENKILSPSEKVTLTPENWNKSYVWTSSGDSIFIRDNEQNLVYWDSY